MHRNYIVMPQEFRSWIYCLGSFVRFAKHSSCTLQHSPERHLTKNKLIDLDLIKNQTIIYNYITNFKFFNHVQPEIIVFYFYTCTEMLYRCLRVVIRADTNVQNIRSGFSSYFSVQKSPEHQWVRQVFTAIEQVEFVKSCC